MAENVYTKVLQQAAQFEGSTQSVASLLRVPEGTLVRWMSGRSQMPLRAFLKAIDLVAKHELASGAAAAPPDAPAPERLRFNVAHTFAECVACRGSTFRRVNPGEPLRYTSMLACVSCGAAVKHADLVMQLAEEVGRHARERLAVLRQRRVRRKVSPEMRTAAGPD